MTIILYKLDTGEIIWSQSGNAKAGMGDIYCTRKGLDMAEYGELLSDLDLVPADIKQRTVVNGVLAFKETVLEEAQSKALEVVYREYGFLCTGKLRSGDMIYVDCVANGTTYRMNAGQEAATNMDAGVKIFELSGASYMPVVRDFYNVNHANVPIADARSIALQQGADALNYWQQKGAMVDAINAATTVEEVEAIDVTFSVNTEP